MTNLEFCYWAQGYFEVAKPETINAVQLQEIKNHLSETLNPTFSYQPSGVVFNQWGKTTEQKEKEQIYITITNHPVWSDKTSYSDYSTYDKTGDSTTTYQNNLLKNLGIDYSKSVYLIVDNGVKPTKETNVKNLEGKDNHLVGVPNPPGYGLRNVGTYPNHEALIC